jgi:FAD/FMN-containing dehydrogenase/Fe-S oxidoreductase
LNDSDIRDLEGRLRESVRGEVRFDLPSRLLYSTDASIYQIEPLGVVIPRAPDDVFATFEAAREFGVPILPRGAGTSLAGQTVGRALVVDASKHLNRILEVDLEARYALVEPGVVQEHLNRRLRGPGFLFGPDTATANRATLGGMIGNNSAGSHSIVYGKTVDHVEAIDAILATGESRTFGELEPSRAANSGGIEGRISRIVARHREEIDARFPRLMRRVSGYNLDELVRKDGFNLARLLVGSEGTLAWVQRARVRIEPRPPATALMVVHFRTLDEAVEASEAILPLGPSAVELVDQMILGLARGSLGLSREIGFLEGAPGAVLIVEFFGESAAALDSRLDALEATLKRGRLGYAWPRALDPAAQARVWEVRKAGLGLLLGMKGNRKPIAFVEDCAVEPAKLPEFFRRFRSIVHEHGTTAGYYGHASVGCLHIRPLIDTHEPAEVRKMSAMMRAVVDLVTEFGGAMSGEHGDGLARSHLNERLFGPSIYRAFREVKRAFDPENRMNPGKIVDGPAMEENLRYGEPYAPIEVATRYDFGPEGGLLSAVELCSGIGVCRKTGDGAMCPSYMVTGEESHSTRGRANLLRAILTGRLPPEELAGQALHDAMDLCLECKACKAECPLGVDMAKLKYEVLGRYNENHGAPWRSTLFARVHQLSAAASIWPQAVNRLGGSSAFRKLLDRWLRIDSRRALPPIAPRTFEHWFRNRPHRSGEVSASPPRGQVVLFHDTFMNFNYPEIGKAATRILEAAGYRVELADRVCCGRPMISRGFPDEARAHAEHNARELGGWIDKGYSVVGCEPSCLLTFRDEYPDLLGPLAGRLAGSAFLLEEFIGREKQAGRWDIAFEQSGQQALLHTHCHQKALVGSGALVDLLGEAYQVREIDSGCCGMAGAFGYETEHYAVSTALRERRLLPEVRENPNAVIIASGASCRQQIVDGVPRQVLHPAEALAALLPAPDGKGIGPRVER